MVLSVAVSIALRVALLADVPAVLTVAVSIARTIAV